MVTVEKKTNLILRTNVSIDIVKPAKRLAGNRCCARPKNSGFCWSRAKI